MRGFASQISSRIRVIPHISSGWFSAIARLFLSLLIIIILISDSSAEIKIKTKITSMRTRAGVSSIPLGSFLQAAGAFITANNIADTKIALPYFAVGRAK